MPHNLLMTGGPGTGKTTLLQKVAKQLSQEGYRAGGVYCPEIREGGKRKGFEMVDVISHERVTLAHVDANKGTLVSKYRVQPGNIERICKQAFDSAFQEADYLLIDEIAPMELYSSVFKAYVKQALDGEQPLLAVIHRSDKGFIGEVKFRTDVQVREVTKENRQDLASEVVNQMKVLLKV